MINRDLYIKRIKPFFNTDLVKVLTGMRRSGKSVMLELIKKELEKEGADSNNFISINFEDMRYAELLSAKALNEYITERISSIKGKSYLFFDEIQEVEDWEKCINSLRVSADTDIYITGSNANLLSGELATYLGGRYVEFVIYPLSFSEYLEMQNWIFSDADVNECFRKYIIDGGMPYLGNLKYEREPSKQYLLDLFSSVQLKDIIKRNKVRDIDLLERILSYIIMNIGTTFSSSSLVRFLKNERRSVSVETVLNYLVYCKDAFLIHQVKRNNLQGKQILSTNEKYYITDLGIREALYGTNQRDIQLVLENMVYMELKRRGYDITVGKVGNKEIDFVCEKGSDRIYVQVTYILASEDTIEREFGVFNDIKDNYPKYVLSLDEFDFSRNGIMHMNIKDFLLSDII